MKTIKLYLLLISFFIICSDIIEIENGQTYEIIFGDESEKKFIYNFIVPESDIYEEAILIYKLDFDNTIFFSLNEDGIETSGSYYYDFLGYHLSSIENKTITFTIKKLLGSYGKFTLLDLTKEINTSLDNLINIIPTNSIHFLFDPLCKINYNIEEVDSEQTYFFRSDKFNPHTIFGNGYVEYCFDENCKNNIYNSSKVIKFKKGSKYKIKINYIYSTINNYFEYMDFDVSKYSVPIKLNRGVQIYNIDKDNLDHYYIIDGKDIDSFIFYSKSHKYLRYTTTTKELINNLPMSLDEMTFDDFSIFYNFEIESDKYVIIILTDNKIFEKNLFYLFNNLVEYKEFFETFTIFKGTYTMIHLNNDYVDNFFISIESSKPCLKIIEDIDSFEKR